MSQQTPAHHYEATLDGVYELLNAAPSVQSVSRKPDRYPSRLAVTLTERTLADAADVRDVLRAFDARIHNPNISGTGATATIAFDITVPEEYTSAGQYALREHGDSTVITISQHALDVSGFSLGDTVDLDARDGEIRLTPNR